ncbi:hypothetical protein KC332_g15706 [Hortaea werneckii]|uniref:Uncharacterized protein n=2 Tax=Hortaea werneckii TaxID=91943 RepID=A0A3M7IF58_HORWE|nr:hypothetical protein KC358_g12704 [Hortaea werneckii]OTA30723.1 hypothetical protein BTJ68_09682 [Hortaea werneckii EXF-2000]KAI6810378.1 hypothetical protein KC350_g12548 [Hortaea werneckii]KAI6911971.1 hypothetical protein KC348_g12808 [Hortaea werneckii]KAI6926898.1 hypothetical protein KC341_g12490 [Hortaea werneckii]
MIRTSPNAIDDRYRFDKIDYQTFADLLSKYPSIIPPELQPLDHQRLNTIPAAIHQRNPKFIPKDELLKLTEWKLSHGKFRPTLLKLVDSNDVMTVKTTAIEAYRLLPPTKTTAPNAENIRKVLDVFTRLKGVGAATATLLMASYDQTNIPFFSDEVYRWIHHDDAPTRPALKGGGASGWTREVRYTIKDYLDFYPKVQQLRERLSLESNGAQVTALEIEKVAYVLGTPARVRKERVPEVMSIIFGTEPPPSSKPKKRKPKAEDSQGAAPDAKALKRKASNDDEGASAKSKKSSKKSKGAETVVKNEDVASTLNPADKPAPAAASEVQEGRQVDDGDEDRPAAEPISETAPASESSKP